MTSILTNAGAISALQTLRSIDTSLQKVQGQVSSGLRVGGASDNAAYWSIATTMRSDRMAVSAVSDALGLGAAKVDTAYAGMSAVVDVLKEIKAKVVTATEEGVDRAKVQEELEQLKAQITSVATSSSFSGENWLRVDTTGQSSVGNASVVSSFTRSSSGVSVQKTEVDLARVALFTSTGLGLLDAGQIGPGGIGGMRGFNATDTGAPRTYAFNFAGPLTFVDDTTEITFDIELDGDEAHVPARQPGIPHSITVNRTAVDAFNPALNGQISTPAQMAALLDSILQGVGANASSSGSLVAMSTNETSGLRGANFKITNIQSTLAGMTTGGMSTGSYPDGGADYYDYIWAMEMKPNFFTGPFVVDDGVVVSFDISMKGNAFTAEIDHNLVNSTLGTSGGEVNDVQELRAVLEASINAQGGGINVGYLNGSTEGSMLFELNRTVYPDSGSDSFLTVGNFRDNVFKSNQLGISQIDVTSTHFSIAYQLESVEAMLKSTTAGAAVLGALQSRIDLQTEFAARMMSTMDSGIGRLVDADMNEASTRLKAMQTRQQLAIQSLSIANTSAEHVMQLFR